MATFDTFADAPFQIKREGQEIVVRQARLSPTTIRVSWTFPTAMTCDLPFVYNGAIVTLDRQPTTLQKLPTDGTIYVADATADVNLHAGSRIGSALVVGAFYNDVMTGHVDVTDAPDTESFYVSVHAVDNVHRYHTDGVHSYSLPYGKDVGLPTSGAQMVFMGASGVYGTTPTHLTPTSTYHFTLTVDGKLVLPIVVSGATCETYADLISSINNTIATKDSPIMSATTPGAGQYWLNVSTRELKQFDGQTYADIPGVLFSTADPLLPNYGDYWFKPETSELFEYSPNGWDPKFLYQWPRDPRNPYCNDYWYDGAVMRKWNGGAWIVQTLVGSSLDPQLPPVMSCEDYWVSQGRVYQWDEKSCSFKQQASSTTEPVSPTSGQIWLDAANGVVFIWSEVDAAWLQVSASFADMDPSLPTALAQGTVWLDTISTEFFSLDGTSWVKLKVLLGATKPQAIAANAFWFNQTDKKMYKMYMGMWQVFVPLTSSEQPNIPKVGAWWYQQSTSTLNTFDGTVWTNVPFSKTSVVPASGTQWFDTSTNTLRAWNGTNWAFQSPAATVSLNELGNIKFASSTTGSKSTMCISDPGTLWNTMALTPIPQPQQPVKGTDPVSSVPSYMQVGVGTDGSQDERRALMTRIKATLGYPTMEVELTKEQMDTAIDMALEKLRAVSSAPYKRGYFALDLQPRVQQYILTDETVGFNKVTDVLYLYRQSASFLGQAAGNNVYGQMMVQNLFNMGKFDLLSYHMLSSYMETMRQVFATEIQFNWDEKTRTLTLYKDLPQGEKLLVDAMVERTEQDLITDRKTRPWIQKYATAQCRYMLAEIRGKFSTLPGAGGNVTLNASDLRQAGDKELQECMDDVDNFVMDGKTEFGMATDFVLG